MAHAAQTTSTRKDEEGMEEKAAVAPRHADEEVGARRVGVQAWRRRRVPAFLRCGTCTAPRRVHVSLESFARSLACRRAFRAGEGGVGATSTHVRRHGHV